MSGMCEDERSERLYSIAHQGITHARNWVCCITRKPRNPQGGDTEPERRETKWVKSNVTKGIYGGGGVFKKAGGHPNVAYVCESSNHFRMDTERSSCCYWELVAEKAVGDLDECVKYPLRAVPTTRTENTSC